MFFTDLLIGSVAKVIKEAGKLLDELFTSEEEKLKARVLLEKVTSELKAEISSNALKYEKIVADRWKSDNEHLATRLVRPFIVVWSYFLLTLMILFDGNIGNFHVNKAYVPLIETVVVTVTVAYFGSRGVEKVSKFLKRK